MGESDTETVRAIREATALADLSGVFGTDSAHDIYFQAKEVWSEAIRQRQADDPEPDGLPGSTVEIDGHAFHVHGVTHADTDAEREYLRDYVSSYLDRGAIVYCEQGIRPMYFEDMSGVCEMDDYLWAKANCEELDGGSQFEEISGEPFDSVIEDVTGIVSEFREMTFSLIDAGSGVYGERFEQALGDIAAEFLTDHADYSVGNSYEAFRLSREASEDPRKLRNLQQYYERTFLPQPLEREWLRRHDPKLELVSHARNERMAEYVVFHNETVEEVHLIVGAAHQHGICHYLEQYRDGKPQPTEFQLY